MVETNWSYLSKFRELTKLFHGSFPFLPEETIDKLLAVKDPAVLQNLLRRSLVCFDKEINDIVVWKKEWEEFYFRYFNKKKDFSNLLIPGIVPNIDHLQIIDASITFEEIFRIFNSNIISYKISNDLKEEAKHDRDTKTDYAFWHRGREEPDREHIGITPYIAKTLGIKMMNFKEYLIFFLKYHFDTERFIDVDHQSLLGGTNLVLECYRHCGLQDQVVRAFWETVNPASLKRTNVLMLSTSPSSQFFLDSYRQRIREIIV